MCGGGGGGGGGGESVCVCGISAVYMFFVPFVQACGTCEGSSFIEE